ncbi:MAG: hypothetical protein CMH83_06405 [Nocardioides sp.]|nr:hypothetical protein [Nocardioides sp.]
MSDRDGLAAVLRVRAVRERDSRAGLAQAIAEVHTAEAHLARMEESVRQHAGFVEGDLNRFVAMRHALAALRHAVTEARERTQEARTVALDAHARWQADKTRLGAVEGLVERREQARRDERRRADDRVLDEIAGQGWLRARGVEVGS